MTTEHNKQGGSFLSYVWSARGIQRIIAALWIVDGLLQLQPAMFTHQFADTVIRPTLSDQPVILHGLILWATAMIAAYPAAMTLLFAVVQLTIGVLILVPRTLRLGLVGSIIWGMVVWVGGEAFGGLLTGDATLLMGLPGAALLYSLLSLAVWPRRPKRDVGVSEAHPAHWLVFVWLGVWVISGIYQLLPTHASFIDMIRMNAVGAPDWLSFLDLHTAAVLSPLGVGSMAMSTMQMGHMTGAAASVTTGTMLVALSEIAIGVLVLVPGWTRRIALSVGMVILVIFWVIGQSLGGFFTGLMTDLNTAPLLILIGLMLLADPTLSSYLQRIRSRVERVVVGRPVAREDGLFIVR